MIAICALRISQYIAYLSISQYIANILQYIVYCNNILYIATIFKISRQYLVYRDNISRYIAIHPEYIAMSSKVYSATAIYHSSNASSSSSSTRVFAQSPGVSESKRCCTDLASGQSSLLALRNISMSRLSGSIFFLNAVIFSLHLENSLSSKLVVG